MGLIEDSGDRGISRDPRKKAIVWIATPQVTKSDTDR